MYIRILLERWGQIELMVHEQNEFFIGRNIEFIVKNRVIVINEEYIEIVVLTDSQILIVIFTVKLQTELDSVVNELKRLDV